MPPKTVYYSKIVVQFLVGTAGLHPPGNGSRTTRTSLALAPSSTLPKPRQQESYAVNPLPVGKSAPFHNFVPSEGNYGKVFGT